MTYAKSTSPVARSALVLGSAIAIAGLVAAAPAHAATSGSQCNGSKMSKSTDGSMGNSATKGSMSKSSEGMMQNKKNESKMNNGTMGNSSSMSNGSSTKN